MIGTHKFFRLSHHLLPKAKKDINRVLMNVALLSWYRKRVTLLPGPYNYPWKCAKLLRKPDKKLVFSPKCLRNRHLLLQVLSPLYYRALDSWSLRGWGRQEKREEALNTYIPFTREREGRGEKEREKGGRFSTCSQRLPSLLNFARYFPLR